MAVRIMRRVLTWAITAIAKEATNEPATFWRGICVGYAVRMPESPRLTPERHRGPMGGRQARPFVEAVNIATEPRHAVRFGPAGQIGPNHRRRMYKPYFLGPSAVGLASQLLAVPLLGAPARDVQKPRREIVNSVHAHTAVRQEPVVAIE